MKHAVIIAHPALRSFTQAMAYGYREAAEKYPARVIAMSVFASGGIPPREAIEWVTNEPYVESIVFGASGRANIENTVALIREFDKARKSRAA